MALPGTQMVKEWASQTNPSGFYGCKEQSWLPAQGQKGQAAPKKADDLRGKSDSQSGEAALICATQCGDLNSFNQLVLTYQDHIFNTALNILGDAELAADVTQDTFISAFRNINKYRGGSFKAWLMRTVINGCYDELRRQKRRHSIPLEPTNDEDDEMETPRWLTDSSPLPEEKFENSELEQAIHHCLEALPPYFRAVVVLVDIHGMNYCEVASAMQVPVGTVRSRLARARQSLRKSLQEFGELLPDSLCSKHEIHI